MEPQKFSVYKRMKSFQYAWEGINSFLQREHNAWLHFMATVVVITLAALLHLSRTDMLAIVFAVGFVWVTEMFNTCIEHIMDFVSVKRHPDIKFIKDLSAGAVLVSALTAVTVGLIVFIPKLF